jgi:hypothetical protein
LWHPLSAEITRELGAGRWAHPKATLRAIEIELATRLKHLRARLLEDLALTRATAAGTETAADQPPRCPDCHLPLQDRGAKPRTLQDRGAQALALTRSYGVCPACGAGLFPPR